VDARQQFVRVEGLVEIIVGALFESQGALGRLAHPGQQDGGRPVPAGAQPAQHFAPIQARHQHIQQEQIGAQRGHFFQRAAPSATTSTWNPARSRKGARLSVTAGSSSASRRVVFSLIISQYNKVQSNADEADSADLHG
jgi:hypothetical protein